MDLKRAKNILFYNLTIFFFKPPKSAFGAIKLFEQYKSILGAHSFVIRLYAGVIESYARI